MIMFYDSKMCNKNYHTINHKNGCASKIPMATLYTHAQLAAFRHARKREAEPEA